MAAYVPFRARRHRYRQFAAKYVQNGYNGLQTVLECGFTDKPDSAKVIASRLLTYVYVDEQIKQLQAQAKMEASEVLDELSLIARAPIPQNKFSENAKLKALELLGKGHKLFIDKVESVDLTQQSASESALLKSIQSAAKRDNIADSDAAVQLYQALSDDPQFSDLASWPAQYRPAIQAQLQTQEQVIDVSGEQ